MNTELENHASDEALIRSAAGGDSAAFGELYDRYLDPIYRYIYYRLPNEADAEDITEEVFIRTWIALQKRSADLQIRNFRAWLYRVAHNLVVDYFRKTPAVQFGDAAEAGLKTEADRPAEQASQQSMEAAQLETALQALEPKLQQVIILRFINGLSHAEAASVIGIKENHVRVLQFRALKKLRALMEKD